METKTSGGDVKRLARVMRGAQGHWVGDGFPVRSLFFYGERGAELSPFLLLDYGGPAEFPPTTERLGVGPHPHRGFETVTVVFDGEVEHRDSSGAGGRIGRGDVQWMTAGRGVVHEEFHGREFAKRGGPFEMAQLWVNLPRAHKLTEPRYQEIAAATIPVVELPNGAGAVRVIAGEHDGVRGPAKTFTSVAVRDLRVTQGASVELESTPGHTCLLAVLQGVARIGDERVGAAEVAVLDRDGARVRLSAEDELHALLLTGEPIDEPIVGRGPFVMNTEQEIWQAIADFQRGRMGNLD